MYSAACDCLSVRYTDMEKAQIVPPRAWQLDAEAEGVAIVLIVTLRRIELA